MHWHRLAGRPLLNACASAPPAVSAAEARILWLDVNLRPALPDNAPRIEHAPGLLCINGLFRLGWLLAPALVAQALHPTGCCPALPSPAGQPATQAPENIAPALAATCPGALKHAWR